MRLPQIDRGDSFRNRLLIRFISIVSGMRLPDAARVALYHKNLFSAPLGAWTHVVMRGPSQWTVGERERQWSRNGIRVPFAWAPIAPSLQRQWGGLLVDAVLTDFRSAPISNALKGTLAFLETMTSRPCALSAEHAKEALRSGATAEALTDAASVAALFNIIIRYGDALDFAMPSASEFDRAAKMLLKRGYAS
jgi:hypothetical protein